MDTSNPYGEEQAKKKKKPPAEEVEEKDEETGNLYNELIEEDEEHEEDEDEERSLDENGEDEEEETSNKKNLFIIIGGIVLVVAVAVIYFGFIKDDPEIEVPAAEAEEAINPAETLKDELYKMGIGKEAVKEKNIYEQGSIESGDFRKDFVNNDSPENYVLPIEIMAVNDSVSYVKHRTMTDDGIDMYWADAEYKGKKTRFTVPYYIWQTLAPQGVMDVIAEVVTDAEGHTFVTSITAVPPSTEE